MENAFPLLDCERNPISFSNLYTRFALGDVLKNGSFERVTQAAGRASQLWRDVFRHTSKLVVVIDDWDSSERELWPSDPPNYLYSLIDASLVEASSLQRVDHDGCIHDRRFVRCDPAALDHEAMIRGIANREQGMTPRINQTVYCIDIVAGIAFYMYDDRGCLVYFNDRSRCESLHELRLDWVVR